MNLQSEDGATAHVRARLMTGSLIGAAVITWVIAAVLVWGWRRCSRQIQQARCPLSQFRLWHWPSPAPFQALCCSSVWPSTGLYRGAQSVARSSSWVA